MAPFSSAFHLYRQFTLCVLCCLAEVRQNQTLTEVVPGPTDPDGPADPDAILIAVGIVAESQFKTTPVGNWNTYTSGTYKKKEFDESKYTLLIVSPKFKNDPTFAPDFPIFITALKKLQAAISKTGINKWLLDKDGDDDAIRFAFKIFEPKTPSNSDSDIDITKWPVPTQCRDELEKIADSHVIREFRVFDTDDLLSNL
ncbi:hypothetical protein B0H13DRAFT_2282767 [Mycena leptocephala]|nr:hypothetical protein B0H13DRAFT_2282767 [Mycena leptocephala]